MKKDECMIGKRPVGQQPAARWCRWVRRVIGFATAAGTLGAWLPVASLAQPAIPNYRIYTGLTRAQPRQLVLRQWLQRAKKTYWIVDPQTLETRIAALPDAAIEPLSWLTVLQRVAATPYGRAIQTEQRRDQQLQDAGLERTDTTERGFSLTIDLCPSTKPLTRSVFEELINAFGPEERPVPVTITVSGLWMRAHADDLLYLKKLAATGKLDITWVNHSYHHRYDPKRPLATNFLLEPGTDLRQEVLLNEQAMIQNGLVPAVFFRFPGLVSDKVIFDQILAMGLLPIGSDAWLAKGQSPVAGSLVLIHANGNEPLGIADFTRLVRAHAAGLRNKHWLLYELPASVARDETP